MAEITLGAVALAGNASVSVSKIIKISIGASTLNTVAAINGKAIKIMKSSSSMASQGAVSSTGRLIKYVKATPVGKASVITGSHKYKTAAARISSKAEVNAFVYDRDILSSMTEYLPPFYREFRDFNYLIKSEANEFTRLYALLDELLYQFFIGTATFSLNDWEKSVEIQSTEIRSLDARRERVRSKVNGPGTLTPSTLKNVVDAFYETEVIELPEPGTIEFKITGERGEPENFDEYSTTVREVLPAHLEPSYIFTYLPWSELEASGLTWNEIEHYTWHELERAFLI